MQAFVSWKSGMAFEADNRNLLSHYDTTQAFGGSDSACTPKEAVLNAMCACSGMDVVSISAKMRLKLSSLKMEAVADKTKTVPSFFAGVHLKYFLQGEGESDKFIKAVVLSMTKYCGVSYMIAQACPVTYEIHLNDQLIYKDQAKFALEVVENG